MYVMLPNTTHFFKRDPSTINLAFVYWITELVYHGVVCRILKVDFFSLFKRITFFEEMGRRHLDPWKGSMLAK